MTKNKEISWLKITIWLIIFYPVGFYLIFKKLTSKKKIKDNFDKYVVSNTYNYYYRADGEAKDKKVDSYKIDQDLIKNEPTHQRIIQDKLDKMAKKIKKRKNLGIGLMVFGGLYLLGSLSQFTFSSIFFSFLFISAGFLLISLNKNKADIISLANKYIGIIKDRKTPYIKDIAATSNTSYEIASSELQYLIDVNILEATYIDYDKKIIHTPLIEGSVYSDADKSTDPEIIECKYCGGVNEVKDDKYICQFCGSPLK